MDRIRRFGLRVAAIASKEAAHIRRDPRTLYMAIGMPLLLVVLFGFGVRFDVDGVPFAVVDLDRSAASREVTERMTSSGDLVLAGLPDDVAGAETLLRRNRAAAAMVLPPDLSESLARGERVTVQVLVDGSDGSTANQVLAMSDALGRAANSSLAPLRPPLVADTVTRYNPTGESAMFLVPGIIAYVLALTAVLLTALTVAREWERGSMEQLFATPVGRLEIVAGKLLPYLALGILEVIVVLGAGAAVFDVPFRGSLALVMLASTLFLVGMLGQGLLISIVTRNQMVATQVGTLSAMLPSMLLSGFLFPLENLPPALWVASFLVPARWLIAVLRSVLLKGAGFDVVWPQLLGLVFFAVLMLGASTLRFQRRIA